MSERVHLSEAEVPTPSASELSNMFPDAEEAMEAGLQPETETTSEFGDRIRSAADRVATILDNRAGSKAERQEARDAQFEHAKDLMKGWGSSALHAGKEVGMTSLGLGVLAAETVTSTTSFAYTQIISVSKRARGRVEARIAAHQEKRKAKTDQNEAYDSYASNIEYTQAVDAAAEVDAQKVADQNEAYDSYSDNIQHSQAAEAQNEAYDSYAENIVDTAQRDANEENLSFEARKRDATLRKDLALRNKARRRAKWGERLNTTRAKGGELVTSAKGYAKRFGRAALATFKRVGRTAQAASQAGREAWTQ